MYEALVKWTGNHYEAGQRVTGPGIKQNPKTGEVLLFDQTEHPYPFDITRDEFVVVVQDSVKLNGERVRFAIKDETEIPDIPEFAQFNKYSK